MLIIDGVKYQEWTPKSEEEFEEIIKEHAKDIFGEDSIYFDLKKKLKTRAGIGSIPDGYVISLQEEPRWYICEVELHTHSLYEHIIAQLQKIITAAKTLQSQKVVADAIYSEIKSAPFKEALIKNKIGTEDLYHFIANLISKPPILVIPIDQKIDGLEEACDGLPIEEVRIVEFRTFYRARVGPGGRLEGSADHAHLFEPIFETTSQTSQLTQEERGLKQRRVTIKDLIDTNILKVGQTLFRSYKGQRYEGKILNDGVIELTHIGKKFPSINAAQNAVTDGSWDAWYFWHTTREDGTECLLAELRDEYGTTRSSNA